MKELYHTINIILIMLDQLISKDKTDSVATLLSMLSMILSVLVIPGVLTFLVHHFNKELKKEEHKHGELLEELKSKLDGITAEKNARRDYEYEARKRLYEKCEPLLFILTEFAESASNRVVSLARAAKQGKLSQIRKGDEGWLSRHSYYMISSIYYLISPLVVVKLIQKNLTIIDLVLEPRINVLYNIGKILCELLSSDYEIAQSQQTLDYNPLYESEDEEKKRIKEPRVYCKQGISKGWLENALESMIVSKPNKEDRCMTLGEFEKAYKDDTTELSQNFWIIREIFFLFHPDSRPVLWRILAAQAYLYKILIHVKHLDFNKDSRKVFISRKDLNKIRADILSSIYWHREEAKGERSNTENLGMFLDNYFKDEFYKKLGFELEQ